MKLDSEQQSPACSWQDGDWKAESFNSLASCGGDHLQRRGRIIMQALSKFGENRGQKVKFIHRVPSIMVCPQQDNGIDCGVFTGAFAMALAHGVDICTV